MQIVTGSVLTATRASPDGKDFNGSFIRFDAISVEVNCYPIVQYEGITALILLCSAVPSVAYAILKFQTSLVPTIFGIIKSGLFETEEKKDTKYSDEIKANSALLIETLIRADGNFKSRVMNEYSGILNEIDAIHEKCVSSSKSEAVTFPEAVKRLLILI